jgi:hypothetical protein
MRYFLVKYHGFQFNIQTFGTLSHYPHFHKTVIDMINLNGVKYLKGNTS